MKHLQVKLDDLLSMQFKGWISTQGITAQKFMQDYIIDAVFGRVLLAGLYTKIRKVVTDKLLEGEKGVSLEEIADDFIETPEGYTPFFKELSDRFMAIGEVLEFVENYCAARNIPHMGNLILEAKKDSQRGIFRKAFVLAYLTLKMKEDFGEKVRSLLNG